MARYNKQTWVDGVSPVNAERMNHMESGIASSVRTINGNSPDANGNVEVSGGGMIYYSALADGITVNARYSADKDITYDLRKKGPNNIFDFYKIGLVAAGSPVSTQTTVDEYLVSSSGDWHMPYVVKAVNNGDGDNPESGYFTGGNHSYTNTSSGIPTGRTDRLVMYADGKKITAGESGFCRNIRLEWDNYVQGYNTTKADGYGREILREHISMVFDGMVWETQTDIYPLEAITIRTWYGLAAITNNYTYVAYVGGGNRMIYTADIDSDSDGAANAMRFFTLTDTMEIEVDTAYDLGKRQNAENTNWFMAKGTYRKAYANTIAGEVTMETGEMYSMRGRYVFKSEEQQPPAGGGISYMPTLLDFTRRTKGTDWFSESVYINPANKYSVGTPDATQPENTLENVTPNSITVTSPEYGYGINYQFLTKYGNVDRTGKTFKFRFCVSDKADSDMCIRIVSSGVKLFSPISEYPNSEEYEVTIAVSADGKSVTLNGTKYTNDSGIMYIGFYFGTNHGATRTFSNVVLEEVTA